MSTAKKPAPAKKAPAAKNPSPTQEKKSQTEVVPKPSGVSPFGVVFLCLLTVAALLSGAFAFRDKLVPHVQNFLAIPTESAQPLTPPPGFVPIPALKDRPTLNDITPELKAMAQKQAELTKTLAALKQQLAEQPTSSSSNEKAASKLSTLLAKTEKTAQDSLAKIVQLQARLEALESVNTALSAKIEKNKTPQNLQALLSFQTLQSQALSGQPFRDSLQRTIALLEDSSAVETTLTKLEEIAPIGRPSLAYLQKEFTKSVTQAVQKTDAQTEGFIGKVKQNISSIIRVRRVDGKGNEQDTIIAQAEKLLAAGKVKAAYTEILKLDETSKAAFSPWLIHAKAYYQLPEWLTQMQLQIVK